MAYTDDAVNAKLSALNETQESIVTVAQWVIFHRRYADRVVATWLQRVKDSGSNKRLNLIYLANEVAQQSRLRKKDDYIIAFSPILAEATATAYKGATHEIQQKLRRVVEVWRERKIFEASIQDAVEARIDELDKARSSGRKPLLGGSMLSSSSNSAPPELQPIVPLQIAVNKATATSNNAAQIAHSEYDKLTDPTKSMPTPPVHAARITALLKQLASAEGAVNEGIKARRALLEAMEKLVDTNKAALAQEESQHYEFVSRKTTMEAKKREIEDGIMRGASGEDGSRIMGSPRNGLSAGEDSMNGKGSPGQESTPIEPDRPQFEELTPPPVESFTPVGSPQAEPLLLPSDAAPQRQLDADARGPPIPPPAYPVAAPGTNAPVNPETSVILPSVRAYSGSPGSGGGPVKKRRLDDEYTGFGSGDAMADLDDDVAELLRAESSGHLFFLPTTSADSSPLPDLLNRITTIYCATPLPPWSLNHRLFRETAKATGPVNLNSTDGEQPKTSGTRYLQVLSLSHHSRDSYIAITNTLPPSQTRAGSPASSTISAEGIGEPAAVISISSGSQSEEFIQLMVSKFGPLWTPRQITSVRNGQALEVGDYIIRLGEVMHGNNASAMLNRGVVVEIEWIGGDEDDGIGNTGNMTRVFWEALAVKGARECLHVVGIEEGFASVRQWCEILRLRN